MMYEALELAIAPQCQFKTWGDLVVTLVEADSTENLLSLLKERPSELGWRLALLCPDALTEFLEKKDKSWEVKSKWTSKILYVGEKNKSHSIKEDVLDRQYVGEEAKKGLVPLYNAVPPSKGEGGYSTEANLKKGGEPFFVVGGKTGRGYVCLVAVKKEIFEAIKKRKNGELRKDSRLTDLRKIYVGDSHGAEDIRRTILEAVDNDIREWPVLIVGETGTGKEVIARVIYEFSQRRHDGAPFVAVNCGAINTTLISSELFGHVAGAYTDAKKDKMGAWEAAGKGYLFLDEVAEIPSDQQAVLLRALETGTIQRVGELKREIPVEARVISATNKEILARGQQIIRQDLLARLKRGGIVIRTIPLRRQPEVIPALANHLWEKIKKKFNSDAVVTSLPREITDELTRYLWPENVRDLDSALSALHRYQGSSGRELTIRDLRAIELKVPGMVRSRSVVLAPVGQLVKSESVQMEFFLSLSDAVSALKGSALSCAEHEGEVMGLPWEIKDELSHFLKAFTRAGDEPHFHLPETPILIGELKGRIKTFLQDSQGSAAKASAFFKGIIVPKLIEVEVALHKERDQLGRGTLSLQNTDQVILTDDILKLTEDLARHTHEVWRRERELDDWKYGERRDDVLKTNPDLIDYEKLPEKEKDLSRKQALGTLKAIVALGYSIEGPDDEYPGNGVDQ